MCKSFVRTVVPVIALTVILLASCGTGNQSGTEPTPEPLRAEDIYGTWHAYQEIRDDKIKTADEAGREELTASFTEDGTGILEEGDKSEAITWSFEDDGVVTIVDGEKTIIGIYDGTKLTINDSDVTVVFKK